MSLALPIPPTTNHLDAIERARLRRKSQKITRVLGEVPVLEIEHIDPTFPHIQPNISKQGSLTRHGRFSIDAKLRSPSASASLESLSAESSLDDLSIISVRPVVSPDHIRKARLAKLTRHLGENIPPELISLPSTSRACNPRRSLDLTTFPSPLPFEEENKRVQRARSLAICRTSGVEPTLTSTTPDHNIIPVKPKARRGRFLNVMGAQKIVQVTILCDCSICLI